MIRGYIRVSTVDQSVQGQEYGLLRFAAERKWRIDEIVQETASGAKSYKVRKLGAVLEQSKSGDTVIVTEISRLGRSLLEVMEILHFCLAKGVHLYTIKERFELDDSINAKVMAFAFGLAGELERQLISQRTKEALDKKRADGVTLGRPKGSRGKSMLDGKEVEIKMFLEKKVSKASIAKILDCDPGTLAAFIITRKIVPQQPPTERNGHGT
jgi:DNA invertase Pin-like site-specific DNA recombinase